VMHKKTLKCLQQIFLGYSWKIHQTAYHNNAELITTTLCSLHF